jgi:hypothetical protein
MAEFFEARNPKYKINPNNQGPIVTAVKCRRKSGRLRFGFVRDALRVIMKPVSGEGSRQNPWRYGTAGVEFIFTFGFFLAGGWLVDDWLGTRPAFLLLGAVAGFAGGLWRLIRTARPAGKPPAHGRPDDDKEPPSGERPGG